MEDQPMNGKRGEAGIREEIGYFSKLLVDTGLLEFKGGNVSVRDGDDLLITQRGAVKGMDLTESIVRTSVFDVDDEGSMAASSALEVHRAIYQRTDAQAVIHGHPSKTVSLSFFCDELIPIDENGMLYLRPKVSVIAPPSLYGWNLRAAEMGDSLIEENVVVQKWHGTFAKGSDLAEAFHRTRAVEFMSAHLIRVAELSKHFGEPTPLPEEVAEVIGGVPGRGLKQMS
jgi:L-fuculose-phosphate aldolase